MLRVRETSCGRDAFDIRERALSRRGFLQAGTLGLGGLTLADLTRLRAEGAVRPSAAGTSVILIWLSGGPGHMETWDPKPLAPDEYRGPLGAIGTNVAGVQFSELMPEQAQLMDKLAVLRTVNHGTGDHTKGNHWMLTGFEGPAFNAPDNRQQRRPALGSAAARLRGANQPGLPPYVGVPHLRGGTDNLFHYAAYLGGGWNPFIVNSDPNERDFAVRNLTLAGDLTLERMADRRTLLSRSKAACWCSSSSHRPSSAALRRRSRSATSTRVRDAFDISRESDSLRDRYGRHTFGQSALLARRLVEHGRDVRDG